MITVKQVFCKMTRVLVLVTCAAGLAGCNRPADSPVPAATEQTVGQETGQTAGEAANAAPAELSFEGETHLANIKQLTFGGQNAEAYFSHDGTELIFQSTRGEMQCDAIFLMNADGSNVRQVSSGEGATTCSFIAPDGKSIIYASTHLGGKPCPPKPDHSRGYVWALYDSYDIFRADPDKGQVAINRDREAKAVSIRTIGSGQLGLLGPGRTVKGKHVR